MTPVIGAARTNPGDPAPAIATWENEGGRTARPGQTPRRSDRLTGRPNPALPRPRREPRSTSRDAEEEVHVRLARVYDERRPGDDVRVLVDRLWPRGLGRVHADLDEWCRQVAPSAMLRTWYGHDPDRFAEFERRYRKELEEPGRAAALTFLRELSQRQTVTLLTATRRPEASHAAVLVDVLGGEDSTPRSA